MKFANATNLNRKSGVAEWRDLLCAFPNNNSSRVQLSTGWRDLRFSSGLIPCSKHRRECLASGLNREVNVRAGVSGTKECRFEL